MGTVYTHNPHDPLHTPTLRVMVPPHLNPTKFSCKDDEEDSTTTTTTATTVLHIFRNDPYHFENGGKHYLNPHSANASGPTIPLPTAPQCDESGFLAGHLRPEEGAFAEKVEEEQNKQNCYRHTAGVDESWCNLDFIYTAPCGGYGTPAARATPPPTPPPSHTGLLLADEEHHQNLMTFKGDQKSAEMMTNNDGATTNTEVFNHEHNFHAPALDGKVTYVPYPTEEFYCPPPTLPREEMTRLFIGQLPYDVTDMQLQWLCYTFGNGAIVHHPERIMKKREGGGYHHHHNHHHQFMPPPPQYGTMNDRDRSAPHNGGGGPRVSTGCIHAYCHPEDAAALMEGMHKRVLVDDTGVWYAAAEEEGVHNNSANAATELTLLNAYVASMKANKNLRPINRPFDTVVVQTATSTYVPRPPSYNNTKKMVKGGQAGLQ